MNCRSAETRLRRATRIGPQRTAIVISDLLGSISSRAWSSHTPEWVSDIYSERLSESQRSNVRDALDLALRQHVTGVDHYLFVRLLSLARQVELIRVGQDRLEDKLTIAAIQATRSGSSLAPALLGLIAEEGRRRPIEEWTNFSILFGRESLIACAVGVLAHGVEPAMNWIQAQPSVEAREDVLVALLPIVARDADALLEYFQHTTSGPFVGEIQQLAVELSIDLPGFRQYIDTSTVARAGDELSDEETRIAVSQFVESYESMMGPVGTTPASPTQLAQFARTSEELDAIPGSQIMEKLGVLTAAGSQTSESRQWTR
ncbi:MAG: hypothetical protein JWP19_2237 [Rhodoglobus sp.]|nr:hypothetical protein [Rhodoglobus sp.]